PVDVVRPRAGHRVDRRRGGRRPGRGRRDDRAEALPVTRGGRERVSDGRRDGTRPRRERAVIGAVRLPSQGRSEVQESLDELAGLVEAGGGSVVERVVLVRKTPGPALRFGKWKGGDDGG